ncbi:MAG TPA: hypothetical protein VH374_07260 [Polyangia bacterium]|jgi:hypothetical protein|nr:hypothetical protein [Polyangia bacterium]
MTTPSAAEFLVRSFRGSDREALGTLWGRVFPDDPPWNAPKVMIENNLERERTPLPDIVERIALPCSMPNAVESAVDTYIRMCSERDPAVRATMLEACFAAEGRMVTRSREIRGRAALADMITKFLADPQVRQIRVISAIDASGTTFRFRSVVERRDGTILENFDAGEIDATGRISLILAFAGPLAGQ